MANFVVQFGSGNPSTYAGLSPTFIVWNVVGIGATTPPAVTQVPTSSGLYYFTYTPTTAVAFVLDGTATITTPAIRYVSGAIDVSSSASLTALITGYTQLSVLLGTLADSFGTTFADPTTVVGYLKRLQEHNEGNNVFDKTSGGFQYWSRGVTHASGTSVYSGSSTMLIEKDVTDSGSVITKS